jgi:HEPN domain-containing protein
MQVPINNWIQSADYDFKTASHMFKSGRYIYVVFLCHLSIEKILKAVVCKQCRQMPPYTHNLNRLIELADIVIESTHQEFINQISLQSVPTRYPEDFNRLSKHLNKKVAENILQKTRKVLRWLKQNYLKEE